MTENITEAFTRNKFVDKVMGWIPDDPLIQAQYIYYLTLVVFLGLIGYGLTAWYSFITLFKLSSMFSALFMTAIGLISLFGLKQARNNYYLMKEMVKKSKEPIESVETMLKQDPNNGKI